MIDVVLYTRENCHLCDQAKLLLEDLQNELPHNLTLVDVDSSSALQNEYRSIVPVVKVGPYTIKAPIERTDLLVTLKAAAFREQQIADIDNAVSTGSIRIQGRWTKSDGFTLWLSRHYLAVFNVFIFLYVSLPFLAPVLMKVGATTPAGWIYRVYGAVCHELAFRSWFLFGEQPLYPRQAAGVDGLIPYAEATGLDEQDLWTAREYRGNETVGYKVALCVRDVAIYVGILIFGVGFAISGRKIKPLYWPFWILLGILPIGLDGLSQLASQPPLSLIAYRESTPLIRTITGFLFGFITAWFGYPYVEETMCENRRIMETKYKNILHVSQ